jgi:putative transposase
LKEAVLNPPKGNLSCQQRAFDAFRQDYNQERPHEAINQNPPAQVYQPSRQSYPSRLAEPEYPDYWLKRRVRSNGEIKCEGNKIYLSQSLIGQWVGLKPVQDGLWEVHFMSQALGRIDQRRGRVEPVKKYE